MESRGHDSRGTELVRSDPLGGSDNVAAVRYARHSIDHWLLPLGIRYALLADPQTWFYESQGRSLMRMIETLERGTATVVATAREMTRGDRGSSANGRVEFGPDLEHATQGQRERLEPRVHVQRSHHRYAMQVGNHIATCDQEDWWNYRDPLVASTLGRSKVEADQKRFSPSVYAVDLQAYCTTHASERIQAVVEYHRSTRRLWGPGSSVRRALVLALANAATRATHPWVSSST